MNVFLVNNVTLLLSSKHLVGAALDGCSVARLQLMAELDQSSRPEGNYASTFGGIELKQTN